MSLQIGLRSEQPSSEHDDVIFFTLTNDLSRSSLRLALRERGSVPGGGVRLALAARLCLPQLRRAETLRHQDPCPLPVHVLPTPDLGDRRHDLRLDQGAAAHLFRHASPDAKQGRISSLELGRRLGVTQNTAWKRLKHKLMQVMMERDAGKRLTGRVEMDDAYLGGERSGGKRGRGAPGKTPIIAAVETTPEPAGAPKLRRVKGFRRKEVEAGPRSLDPTSTVVSDGLGLLPRRHGCGMHASIDPHRIGRKTVLTPAFKWSTPRSATSRPPLPPPTGRSARSTSLATWPKSSTASIGAMISPP